MERSADKEKKGGVAVELQLPGLRSDKILKT
jgi:hypothetical protein